MAACLLLVACTLAILASVGTAQAASTSITFKSLGYSTATNTTFTLNFTSPYVEASGQLGLHFQTFDSAYLVVLINGATVYGFGYYPVGVQWDYISLPTGVIDQGINTLQLTFSQSGSPRSTTVYEDSLITLTRAPVAADDAYNTNVNTTLNVSAPGVLSNDTDADGDTLTAVLGSTVGHGTLTLNANGSFSYTPTARFNGTDSFTYKASDGVAQSNAATVTIVVTQVPPSQPSNVSPVNGATDVILTPTLGSSAFSDPDNGDTHAASQWQITTTSGSYTSPVFDSGVSTANQTQITVPSGKLQLATTYYWHVRHQDSYSNWSAYSTETSFTTRSNQMPVTPSNASPASGATGVSVTPTLKGSAFSDPDAGDTHAASQWQITTTLGSYTSPVFDSGVDTANKTQISVPSGKLSYNTAYYWHVKYQDSYGNWSAYSTETSLTTTATQVPATPSNASPASGATGVSVTPTLRGSTFSDPDAGDTHAASQWQITATSGSYTSPVFDSGVDTANKTQINVPSGKLSYNTAYYWHVRYQDSYGSWSAYSAQTSFTTGASAAPDKPSNVSPANGATDITSTPTLVSSAFSDPDSGDAHAASQWQISTVSGNYFSPMFDSGTDSSNLTSIAVPSGKLQLATTYYWRVRHQDSLGNWSAWSAETSFTTEAAPNQPPAQPNNVSPAEGVADANLSPTLSSSAFTDPDTGDTHAASQWQVTAASGNYLTPAFDSGIDTANLTEVSVPSDTLSGNTTYYWRVRHQDNHGSWSSYSTQTSFITAVTQAPAQPSNVSPANGDTNVSLTPTLSSSAFVDPDTGDAHAATEWHIGATPGDYSSPVFDSGVDSSNLTQITLPSGILETKTTYYWRVRHRDSHGQWSAWSEETSFSAMTRTEIAFWVQIVVGAALLLTLGMMAYLIRRRLSR
jgi:VCBS repeat-containing protein